MEDSLTDTGSMYSPLVGLVYVFNLIVGTGALTMPRAFAEAGWLVSIILISVLAFTSYMTATFVIECMASANAVQRILKKKREYDYEGDSQVTLSRQTSGIQTEVSPYLESTPLLAGQNGQVDGHKLFDITRRVEMGQMASMFYNKVGVNMFYLCIALYLYGDLAIYVAAVPKSLRDVVCTYSGNSSVNGSHCNHTLIDRDQCWPHIESFSRLDAYRVFVVVFTLTLGPFVFFNIQKTMYLQVFTSFMRWLSFSMMIVLAFIRISQGKGQEHRELANIAGIPTLFGVCVYSFMCHHSLPSLATPIRDKSRIHTLFGLDYLLILGFYVLLSFTAIFSFRDIKDLYTLNFKPNTCDGEEPITNVVFIQYFLALFPVFTLSTNFPIIAITLRNNLKTLCHRWAPFPWAVDRLVFPVAAMSIPVAIALATDSVEMLVGITGSYAGAAIQYFIPATLVLCSRKLLQSPDMDIGFEEELQVNKHKSPFGHIGWVIAVLVWGALCIVFVTVNYGLNGLTT